MTFRWYAAAVLMLLAAIRPASAGSLTIEVRPAAANAGGAGSFDVVLVNGTGGEVDVSSFSVELSVPGRSGVTFTAVTADTILAPYLFGTLQNSPFSYTAFPGPGLLAGDSDMTAPGYVAIADGATVGLMHVDFAVANWAPAGPVGVSIVPGDGTQVLDADGGILDVATADGTITVAGAAVPEPPSLVAMATASAAGLASLARGRRRRGLARGEG